MAKQSKPSLRAHFVRSMAMGLCGTPLCLLLLIALNGATTVPRKFREPPPLPTETVAQEVVLWREGQDGIPLENLTANCPDIEDWGCILAEAKKQLNGV